MRKTIHTRKALTLCEMVIALAAVTIVFFAAAIILVAGQRSWDRTWRQATLQRDASVAMLRMMQTIHGASRAELEDNGNTVKIYDEAGWTRFRYDPGQRDIVCQVEDQQDIILLDNVVEDANFAVDNSKVSMQICVEKYGCDAQLAHTTVMRNWLAGT
jgi:competence protein ComGC